MAENDFSHSRKVTKLRLVGAPRGRQSKPSKPDPAKLLKGRYHYPKALLRQAYFCLGGTGIWREPELSLDMVSNPQFVSPLVALLSQLESEGHDVAGARIELMTYREQVAKLCDDFERIGHEFGHRFASLGRAHSILARAMYSDPTKGGTTEG